MKTVTLLFLVTEETVLLAMKRRGFGMGKWNGVGGKIEPNETIEQAAVRECIEEIGVTPLDFTKVAEHFFTMEGSEDIMCHTYIANSWEGKPVETDEMAPRWFKKTDIPYAEMWQDDIVWMPLVLSGKKVKSHFTFDEKDNMLSANLTLIESLE
jgi:8-oxo-dGTP pyrophosphatase MutT (NUDIX family)